MNQFRQFCQSRTAWFALMFSAVFIEAAALFFQYEMKLDPCVMCIYQRLAVVGLLIAGCTGALKPKSFVLRNLAMVIWAISAFWGAQIAFELVELQNNPSPFATCPFLPNFPEWFALHEWIPSVFMPTGMCSDQPWQFIGITMAEWTLGILILYCLIWCVCLPGVFSKNVTLN